MKLLALAGLAMLVSGPAFADGLKCEAHADVLKLLHDQYHEIPTGGGITAGGLPTVLTESAATWTLLLVMDDKLCYLAAGKTMGKDA